MEDLLAQRKGNHVVKSISEHGEDDEGSPIFLTLYDNGESSWQTVGDFVDVDAGEVTYTSALLVYMENNPEVKGAVEDYVVGLSRTI